MSREDFLESQRHFAHAVAFFPRPMAALVARLPDPRQRLDLLRNLVEEHGDFREEAFHISSFRDFLTGLGGPGAAELPPLSPGLHAFQAALTGTCCFDELETGLACLGFIEYAFAELSSLVATAVIERGWISPRELRHYRLHARIDEEHAAEFFLVIESAWDEPARRLHLERGLALGAQLFRRLYDDLAEVKVPHA
jgi:pyrroloquinoline-quinone synthase